MHNSWNKTLLKVWNSYSQDVGKSLIHLGALGWIMCSAAQTLMVCRHKNINKKEKQFLVPQEIADGAINVGLYYTVCQSIKKTGDKLLENAKIMTKETSDLLKSYKKPTQSVSNFLENFDGKRLNKEILSEIKNNGRLSNFYNTLLFSIKEKEKTKVLPKEIQNNSLLKNILRPLLNTNDLKSTKNAITKNYSNFLRFKNGVGVISISLSIITCNVITPVARNITANYFQKKALKKTITNNKKVVCNPKISRTYDIFKI